MSSVTTPIVATPEQLAAVTYNADGLVPAIVQEYGTGQVLMMAWMNEEALQETLESGRTVFWSRSRQSRWRKGDSSGDRQWVRTAYYDCDGDTLLFVVEQEGAGACHTGNRSCFYGQFGGGSGIGPGSAASATAVPFGTGTGPSAAPSTPGTAACAAAPDDAGTGPAAAPSTPGTAGRAAAPDDAGTGPPTAAGAPGWGSAVPPSPPNRDL